MTTSQVVAVGLVPLAAVIGACVVLLPGLRPPRGWWPFLPAIGVLGVLLVGVVLGGLPLGGTATTGGVIAAGLAAFAAAIASLGWAATAAPVGNPPPAREADRAVAADRFRWASWVTRWLAPAIAAAVLAAFGVGVVGVVALVAAATVGLTRRGLRLAVALSLAVGVALAGVSVAAVVVLSPLGWVGRPVPTVLAVALALSPVLPAGTRVASWRGLRDQADWRDLAAIVAGVTGAATWLGVFRGLDGPDTTSLLLRLGEDNISHLMMLEATHVTGTVLGTPGTYEVAGYLAGYYPASSTLAASAGPLLPVSLTTAGIYVLVTALLLGTLTLAVTSVGTMVTIQRRSGLAALAMAAPAAMTVVLLFVLYTYGFAGQLVTHVWLVVILLALLVIPRLGRTSRWVVLGGATLQAVATWLGWPLVTPLVLLACAVAVLEIWRPWRRHPALVAAAVAGGVVVVAVAARLRWSSLPGVLDTLSTPGGVSQAVPFWVAVTGAVALPVALHRGRLRLSLAAGTLVSLVALTMMLLIQWQTLTVGAPNYYSFKVAYFLVSFGLAAVAAAAAVAGGAVAAQLRLPTWARGRAHPALRIGAATAAAAVGCVAVVLPGRVMTDYLAASGGAQPDPAGSCVVRAAGDHPQVPLLAVGFDAPLLDYLYTKAGMTGTGRATVLPFLNSLYSDAPPDTWPWSAVADVVVLPGPSATNDELDAILAAADAAAVTAAIDDRCR